ncbi:MAG: glycoside hydrolase family 3 C-terminal domain-containing protein, partial [Eggerthellaceae bacterium]|nr:glycoside hydrolase family 3 C-terminal domain-containing protein [Eggerthellaceae bacterium]
MIEEGATLLPGDRTYASCLEGAVRKSALAHALGAYNALPAIDAIEVLADRPAGAIVAFGDSITALGKWTKPLAGRIADAYGDRFALLNAGISGNCLLYEPGGLFGPAFGRMGVERFAGDVLEVPNLEAAIIALGVNDASYLDARTASAITLETFSRVITTMVEALHGRGVRVTMQTITPRLGCSPAFGCFTQEMEGLRLRLNDWIRTAGIFDYVLDAEAVVCEKAACGLRFREGLHQGDRLHPNESGGEALACAYDLAALTGVEPSSSQASATVAGGRAALLDYERDHLARIRSGLAECMVLLRKDGSFPLAKPCKLAAYGSGVRHSVKGGTGSGDVNAHVVTGVEQGLCDAGFQLTSETWLDAYDERRVVAKAAFRKQLKREAKAAGDNVIGYAMGAVMPEPDYDIPLDCSADVAIYVLASASGEGGDRKPVAGDFMLTDTEIRDILALNRDCKRFMLVLSTGGPVDLTPVREVGNILVLSQLGSEMGNALADVLLGRANPSGKLTTTWSAWEDYCSDIETGNLDDTPYREGVYVGYRYFDTVGKRALFPFGFGLSYTDFEMGEASVALDGSRAVLSADVRNVGPLAGKEVVQAYVTAPEAKLRKPWQSLAGFAKTSELQPGEDERVTVAFDFADLASFDEQTCSYVLEAGDYVVRFGTSSVDAMPSAIIELPQDITLRTVRSVAGVAEVEEVSYERVDRDERLESLPHLALDPASFEATSVDYDITPEVDPVASTLSDAELAYLGVGRFSGKGGSLSVIGNASTRVAGAAGETTSMLRSLGIEPVVMADGPAGLRLAREFYRDAEGAHSLGAGSIPEGILDVLSAPVRKLAMMLLGGKKPPRGVEVQTQYCTALPIGTAIAQTWNVAFAQECGDIVGDEMERFGVHLWLAPALNIHRSVLCGRNFEYFSEDPLVSGKMAAALVRGVQAHPGRGATIKHFAANNQETNRYFNNSQVSERAPREIYLRGFETCIHESRPAAVMTSYNLVNGVHASESRALTRDFLRAECGFGGVVMTDWVLPLKNRGARWPIARAGFVAAAGGDLFMPGGKGDFDDILAALSSGTVSRRHLEENDTRVLRMCKRLNA